MTSSAPFNVVSAAVAIAAAVFRATGSKMIACAARSACANSSRTRNR